MSYKTNIQREAKFSRFSSPVENENRADWERSAVFLLLLFVRDEWEQAGKRKARRWDTTATDANPHANACLSDHTRAKTAIRAQ
jgi:hypothetical protein